MADVSADEYNELISRGYSPFFIETKSREAIDNLLTDPDLIMDAEKLTATSPGLDPVYGTGGIAAQLGAALSPSKIAEDVSEAASEMAERGRAFIEDVAKTAKTVLDPKSWILVGLLAVTVVYFWKR